MSAPAPLIPVEPGAQAAAAGLSAERLARIGPYLKSRYLDPGRFPGASLLVHRQGQTALFSVQGLADVQRQVPMTADTLFRIYSLTKPITSVAFMMLVEEGLVGLDDPVHRYIPEWRGLGVYKAGTVGAFQTTPTAGPMRIIDLLRHTSGLTYGFQNRTNLDAAYRKLGIGEIEKSGDLAGMIQALAQLPLEFSPGQAWNYSVATDVVGWLIQVISGMPFEAFLQSRLFDPLGMVDTGFHVREGQGGRLASCYAADGRGGMVLQDDARTSSYLKPPAFISGGGGLVSTMGDYLQFSRMLLNGGALDGRRYLSPKTLAMMFTNHLPGGKDLTELSQSLYSEAAYAGIGFGIGGATTMNPAQAMVAGTPGDFFWGGAASTFFWVDPKEQLTCIFMTQLIPPGAYPVRRELRNLVYAAFEDTLA